MARTLRLTNSRLRRMVNNPEYSEFEVLRDPPVLTHAARRRYGCGGCRKRAARAAKKYGASKPQVDMDKVKEGIAKLAAGQKTALKKKLGCARLTLSYKTPRGVLKRLSF